MSTEYSTKDIQKFWSRINYTDNSNECWEWNAGISKKGYGQITLSRKSLKAHRFMWELTYGEIPDGLHVLHSCDNRKCVNPDHLWLGTNLDNMRDRNAKGRQAKGEVQGFAKLTEEQVLIIRKRYRFRSRTDGASALAREFGVSHTAVWDVVNNKWWRHIIASG